MNVEKVNLELFNSFLDKIQKSQSEKEEIDPAKLTPNKSYSFLGLGNEDVDDDYSDLTFDEKDLKNDSSKDTNSSKNIFSNQTAIKSSEAKSSETKSSAGTENNTISKNLETIEKALESVTTSRETVAEELTNLNALYQKAVTDGNSSNLYKCDKLIQENMQEDEILEEQQNALIYLYEKFSEISRVQDMSLVKSLSDSDSRKSDLQNILNNEEAMATQLYNISKDKIEAMKNGDDKAFASLEAQEKKINEEYASEEVRKYTILAELRGQSLNEDEKQKLEIELFAGYELQSKITKVGYLYYQLLQCNADIDAARIQGDQNALNLAQNKKYKIQLVIAEYEKSVKELQEAVDNADSASSTDALEKALAGVKINDGKITQDDGNYDYENEKLYKDGKKYTGEYCGKYYKKGKLYNGKVKDEPKTDENGKKVKASKFEYTLYENGEKYSGVKGKKLYTDGRLTEGDVGGVMYYNGKKYTGLATYTPKKADGTPDELNAVTTYYKKGVAATGKYKGKMYVNGALFTGTYKNKTYVNGIRQ